MGEGLRGSNGASSTLHRILVFHSATHNQTGPLWFWFPSVWACAHSRPLWVSPMTSPVRLGVSPAAVPTPTGAFNQRLEALFPGAGPLGCAVCFDPRCWSGLSMYKCGAVGCYPRSACPVLRHSESSPLGLSVRMWGHRVCQCSDCLRRSSHTPPVSVPPWPLESSPPWCPSPPLLPVWMNVYFLFPWCRTPLPFDSLSVLVVRGGAVCLPMPPSWFSQGLNIFKLASILYSLTDRLLDQTFTY